MPTASTARALSVAIFVALLIPPSAWAQQAHIPDAGSWWSVTVGGGAARLTCDLCQPARDFGPSVDVVVGAFAGPELRLGVEGGFWTHGDGEVRESVYRAGVVGHLRVRPGSALHLIGGVGWSGYRAEEFGYDAARLTLGIGVDLPLGRDWTFGNSITLDASSFGTLENEATTVAREVGLSVVRVGFYVRRQ